MISNFKRIVMPIVEAKKTKVFNPEQKIREIERKLDKGLIDSAGAMKELRGMFSYHLDNNDYRKIEKEIAYNIK